MKIINIPGIASTACRASGERYTPLGIGSVSPELSPLLGNRIHASDGASDGLATSMP